MPWRPILLLRATALALVVLVLSAAGIRVLASTVVQARDTLAATASPPDARMAALLVVVAAAVGATAWLWFAAAVLGCLCELPLGPARQTDRCVPALLPHPAAVRRIVGRLVGVAVGPALLAPVVAGPALVLPGAVAADERPAPSPTLLLPDRTTGARQAVQARGSGPDLPGPRPWPRHRVRPGESLWSIAEARLPPGAPDAHVDRGWRRIYALNRSTVGDDPDLIRTGSVLRLPRNP